MFVSYIEVNDMRKEKNTTRMNRENDLTKKKCDDIVKPGKQEQGKKQTYHAYCLYLTWKSMAGKTSTNHVDI